MAGAVTATLRADITQFERAIADATTKITGLQKSTAQVNAELKKFGNEFSGANLIRQANTMAKAVEDIGGASRLTTAEQRKLAGSVDEALAKYRALGQEVPSALVRISTELKKIDAANEEVAKSARALAEVQKKAAHDVAQAQANFGSNLTTVGSGLTRLGAVMTASVTAPILAGFGLSIKASKDFESAFANVVKTVDGLDVDAFGNLNEDAKKLSGEIRNLAKELPVPVEQLANIAAIGGQFGVSRAALVGFTDTVAKLGVAVDGISAEDAAASLAQIGKIAGLTEGDFNRLASSIVALGNAGTSTEGTILEISKRFAAAGSAAGLSADKIAGVAAAVANLGIEAEAGGSALSKTFNEIGAAVAKGGKDLDGFAKVAGLSSKAFADAFRKDAVQAFDLFLGGLNKAQKGGQDLTNILADLGITELRQSAAIRSLAIDHQNFAKTVNLSTTAFRENTALNEEARKKFATFDNQLQLFENRIKDIGIELGGPLLQGLRSVLDTAQPLIEATAGLARGFADLSGEAQTAVVLLGGGVGLAPVLVLLGGQALSAASGILSLVKAVKELQVAKAAADATGALGTGIGGVQLAAAGALPVLGQVGLLGVLLGLQAAVIKLATGIETELAVALAGLGPLGLEIAKSIQQVRELSDLAEGFGDVELPAIGRASPRLNLTAQGQLPTHEELLARLGILPADAFEPVFKSAEERIRALRAAVADLTPATRKQIDEFKNLGLSSKEISTELGISVQVIDAYEKSTAIAAKGSKTTATEAHKAAEELKRAAEELQKLGETFSGLGAVKEATKLTEALQGLGGIDLIDPAKAQGAIDLYERAIDSVGRLGFETTETTAAQVEGWEATLAALKPVAAAFRTTEDVAKSMSHVAVRGITDVDKATTSLAGEVDKLQAAMRKVQNSTALRAATQGLSGDFQKAAKFAQDFTEEMKDFDAATLDADPSVRALRESLKSLSEQNASEELTEMVISTKEFQAALAPLLVTFPALISYFRDLDESTTEVTSKTVDLGGGLRELSSAFADLAQSSGGALDGVLGDIAQLIGLMAVAAQAGAQVKAGLSQIRAGGAANITSGAIQTGSGIISGVGTLNRATDVMGRGNRAARGAAAGAALGTQILPGWGTAIGAAAGAIYGALRNPAFEDVFKRVARNFGVAISEETARAIADLAKAKFNDDRLSAEIFSLDAIIAESGGLKPSTVAKLQARLRDAFSLREVGKFSAEQLDEVLTKNFGTFANYVNSQTTIASKGFSEILRLAKAFNATTEEMRGFVTDQAGIIGAGLANLAGPLLDQFAGIQDEIAAAKQEAEAAAKAAVAARGGKKDADLGVEDTAKVRAADEAAAAAAAKLAELLAKVKDGAVGAQDEFNRLGVIALAGFNAAIDSGLGFVAALDQIGPGLDQLIQLQKDLGLEGSAALTELLKFRDLVTQNESLVTSAEALNETILALSKIGGLTTESLAAMEGQGLQTFQRLTEAGFSNNEALELMRGFIENVILAHEQLGIPIDENTQKLIDQATAAGILKDSGKSMIDVFKEGFGALIETLGGELPDAWKKTGQAAADAATTMTNAFSGAGEDSAEAVRASQLDMIAMLEATGQVTKEVADQMRKDLETQFAEAVKNINKNLAKIPKTVPPIKVNFDVQPFPDIPSQPPVVVPVEFELPDGYVPGNERDYFPDGRPPIPGAAFGAYIPARPGGTVVRVGEAGRDEIIAPVDELGPSPSSRIDLSGLTFVGELDGQPVLRYVATKLPHYIRTRTAA